MSKQFRPPRKKRDTRVVHETDQEGENKRVKELARINAEKQKEKEIKMKAEKQKEKERQEKERKAAQEKVTYNINGKLSYKYRNISLFLRSRQRSRRNVRSKQRSRRNVRSRHKNRKIRQEKKYLYIWRSW